MSKVRGLNVAVYKVEGDKPDYDRLISQARHGIIEQRLAELVFVTNQAYAKPLWSKLDGYYPSYLSNTAPDLKGMTRRIREDFLLYYRGRIQIPKGIFEIQIKDSDDWASVYLYPDDSQPDSGKVSNDETLRGDIPVVSTRRVSLFQNLQSKARLYFTKETVLEIEIFLVQKKGEFALDIEAVMGLDLEELLILSGKENLHDILDEGDSYTSGPLLENRIISGVIKGQKLAKPLSAYGKYLLPPKEQLIDLPYPDPEDFLSDTVVENSCEDPQHEPKGFKGEIVGISHKKYPVQSEYIRNIVQNSGANFETNRATYRFVTKPNENYWDMNCTDCYFKQYMAGIISDTEAGIKAGKALGREYRTFDEYERTYEPHDFTFVRYGNNTLDFSNENYESLEGDSGLFSLMRDYYNFLQELQGDQSQKGLMESSEQLQALMDPYEERLYSKEALDQKKAELEFKGMDFKDFVASNLFMKTIKLSGRMRLPNGFIKMAFLDYAQTSAFVFINRGKDSFKDIGELESSALIFSYQNRFLTQREEGIYTAIKSDRAAGSKPDDTVRIEIYLFHYSGPLRLKLGIDLDGSGYKDLRELSEFIVND